MVYIQKTQPWLPSGEHRQSGGRGNRGSCSSAGESAAGIRVVAVASFKAELKVQPGGLADDETWG